jgi:hypothetical protein
LRHASANVSPLAPVLWDGQLLRVIDGDLHSPEPRRRSCFILKREQTDLVVGS